MSRVGAAKKKAGRRRAERLPTLEVDVDDDSAIGAIAEALVTAIMATAAGGRARPKKAAKTAKKAKKAAKAKKKRSARKSRS